MEDLCVDREHNPEVKKPLGPNARCFLFAGRLCQSSQEFQGNWLLPPLPLFQDIAEHRFSLFARQVFETIPVFNEEKISELSETSDCRQKSSTSESIETSRLESTD